jgi:hypothetical protein
MSRIPNYLLVNIHNKRTRKLIQKVWKRIPSCDRKVLKYLLIDVSDQEELGNNVLGKAGRIDIFDVYEKDYFKSIDRKSNYINFTDFRIVKSDKACMAVIAHEFAHIVLRHPQFGAVETILKNKNIYQQNQLEMINSHDEEAAELLCWCWGFKKEMEALFFEFSDTERPDWYQEFIRLQSKE